MTGARLAGRVAGDFTGPGFLSDRWDGLVLVSMLGRRALMRSQAVTITGAPGQAAEILRQRRRPLRTR